MCKHFRVPHLVGKVNWVSQYLETVQLDTKGQSC